jgi:hypothetical protein
VCISLVKESEGEMNAYELADLIDSEDTLWMEGRLGDICNMLRQQADRIAELEKQQKTEPDFYSEQGYPLYTTPQIKELSDEEIEKLQAEHTEKGHFADTLNVKDFARAILKKASEK